MVRWALMFFAIALVAALLGFGGLANFSADLGKFLLEIFVVLVVIGIAFGGYVFGRR